MVCILDSTVTPNTQGAVLETGGFPSSCQTKSGLMCIFQYSIATFTFIFLGEEGDFFLLVNLQVDQSWLQCQFMYCCHEFLILCLKPNK